MSLYLAALDHDAETARRERVRAARRAQHGPAFPGTVGHRFIALDSAAMTGRWAFLYSNSKAKDSIRSYLACAAANPYPRLP